MYVATQGVPESFGPGLTDVPQKVPGSWGAGWGSGGLGQVAGDAAAPGLAVGGLLGLVLVGVAGFVIFRKGRR